MKGDSWHALTKGRKASEWGGSDPAAALRRDRVEGDLIYVRWVLLAVATLYLLFSGNVRHPFLGWVVVLLGALTNSFFIYQRARKPFSLILSIVAQGLDVASLLLYTAALQGGIVRYLPLYTTIVVVAAIRFGMWGTVGSGALVLLLGLGAAIIPPITSLPTLAVILGAVLANVVLLGYFAYLTKQQYLAYRRDEERLQRTISEITILHEASSTAHDLKSEDALQNIVEIVTKIMGFQRAALFLTDSVEEMIPRRYYGYRIPAKSAQLPLMSMDPKLFEELLQRQIPIVIDGSQGLSDMDRGPILQIAVPLHSEQGPLGLLVADCGDRQATLRSDKEMLARLAKSAVVAIENASLHRRIKQMANHDGVTELYNHRYFQESLREMIQASEGRWPISLLMIEIDKFKRYNDTFGHRQGDTALYSLSRALEESTKHWNGLVARYGGDEFVVILSRVGRQEAIRVTRALREQVYQLTTSALARHNLPSVTLSIGVATYPDDAQTAGDLIEAADQAMYVVKHSGGDRVYGYSEPGMMFL